MVRVTHCNGFWHSQSKVATGTGWRCSQGRAAGRNFVFTGGRKKDSNETVYKDGLTR